MMKKKNKDWSIIIFYFLMVLFFYISFINWILFLYISLVIIFIGLLLCIFVKNSGN
jgi:predicted membrane protein